MLPKQRAEVIAAYTITSLAEKEEYFKSAQLLTPGQKFHHEHGYQKACLRCHCPGARESVMSFNVSGGEESSLSMCPRQCGDQARGRGPQAADSVK